MRREALATLAADCVGLASARVPGGCRARVTLDPKRCSVKVKSLIFTPLSLMNGVSSGRKLIGFGTGARRPIDCR